MAVSALSFFYAVFLVDISAFKYNGFVFDVRHEDVADIQSFNLSAAFYAALEAQTCVSAAEAVVALQQCFLCLR